MTPRPTLAELAAAEREATPEPAAEARVWQAIEHRLAHGPPPPSLPEPTGIVAAVKWIGGLVLAGGLLTGVLLLPPADPPALVAPPTPPPAAALRPAAPAPPDMSLAPAPAPPAVAPPVPKDTSSKPARAPREAPIPTPTADPLDLAAELRLLARVRDALRRDDAAAALAAISEHKRDFPGGALVQERTAHEVDALCAAGRRPAARALAESFLVKWPDSTHRARVAAACVDN